MKGTKELLTKIKEKDLLAPSLLNLVKLVAEHPGKTASELFNYKNCPCSVKGSVSADLSRLAATGVIQKGEPKSCSATGRKAATWLVTGNLPQVKETNELSEVDRKINELEAKLEKLYKKRDLLIEEKEPEKENDNIDIAIYDVRWDYDYFDYDRIVSDLQDEIRLCAYYKAEKRGFAPGGEFNDWLEAEKEVCFVGCWKKAA
jgi:hypothetical protein